MAQPSHVSDSQALVQSMLHRLRLQEQRSDQASTTSEDLSSRILQDVLDDSGSAAGETLTGVTGVSDNPQSPRTKWPGFRKAFGKTSDRSKGKAGQKDVPTFSDIAEVPKWERKQLRFAAVVDDRISGKGNGLVDEVQAHLLKPPLNCENHTSPAGGTVDSPGLSGEPLTLLTPVTPGCVTQEMTASDRPRQDSLATEDNASLSDSLDRNGQAADVGVEAVAEKTTDKVRKNKRKWAETKTKRFTQKIKDKWRDRHSSLEKRNSKNGGMHTTDEQVASKASSEVQENVVLPSPAVAAESEVTLSAQGYDSISLCAFDLGLGTSLMDEICTGPEWARFMALSDSHQVIPEDTDDHSTYLAEAKQRDVIQAQMTPEVFDSEPMLTDTDTTAASDTAAVMTSVGCDQAVCNKSGEEGVNQLTSSEEVSHDQLWTDEMNSEANQISGTEPNSNGSQNTTENLEQSDMQATTENREQSDMHDICHDQSETASESNAGDIKDQTQTDPDPSQTNTSDMNSTPNQTEITAPTPEETTDSEMDPPEEEMAPPDALDPPDTGDMVNPYLETQTGDVPEAEDVSSCPSSQSQAGPAGGEGEENVIQLLLLTDFSYLKAAEDENSSVHDRRRRALQSEERETFIDDDDDDEDEDDDDDEEDVSPKSLSWQKIPLSPPPFPPPLPPQRSISVDSDSSSSLEILPKKRRLDSTPRRVRFAEKVVILPTYVQPDVEDWPEEKEHEEEDEEEMEDPEDMDDREDMEETAEAPRETSSAKEAVESPREAQPSLYNWILGITKKTKRKGQV